MRFNSNQRNVIAGLVLLAGCAAWPATAGEVVFARHLALSPDGGTLAFSWAGDIWSVPIIDGEATRLTVHPAYEGYPVWSPDGRELAFASQRHGSADVYLMDRDGGHVRRLTFSDRDETPTSFSPDGQWIYFHMRAGDPYPEERTYRIPVTGGQAWPALDCFAADARVSPDGAHVAFVRGDPPWWRRGYRGSGNTDIWLCATADGTYTQLTDFDGADRSPAWNADGSGVYFLSDRSGTLNVWRQSLAGGTAEAVTHMTGDDVRDFAVSADGRVLAFTQWDKLYTLTIADGVVRAIDVTAPDDTPDNDVRLQTFTRNADESEPSPDAEEIALVVHGEIFVIKTEEDKPTRRVTNSAAREHDVVWSPDGKALFFVSDQDGQEAIYRAVSGEDPPEPLSDSLRFTVERVTEDAAPEFDPQVSPDGRSLSFTRGRGDLVIRDVKTGAERVLLTGWNRPTYRWSPDSRWIAYEVEDAEYNADVWVVPADGSASAVNISQHPDYDGNPQWSADGQILAFASRREGFDSDLYFVFLSPALDEKSRVDLDDYFEAQSKAVGKREPAESVPASGTIARGHVTASQPAETQPAASQPATQPANEPLVGLRTWVKNLLKQPDEAVEKPAKKEKKAKGEKKPKPAYAYELDTAYRRIRRVTSLPDDQASFALSPDGASLAFRSAHEGDAKLYTIQWTGEDLDCIVSDGVGALRWTMDGKRLFYLKGGVPGSCSDSGSAMKTHKFRGKLAIVRSAEAAQKFDEAARRLGLGFYHPTMKGLDWPALTRKYRGLALQMRTDEEFNEVFSMLMGELNASHLGIWGPGGNDYERIGYLGLTVDRDYAGPGLKIAAVVPHSPADRAESRLVPGDVLVTVQGQPVGPQDPLERALVDTAGDEVLVEYLPSPQRKQDAAATQPATDSAPTTAASQPATKTLVIRPISYGALADLKYDAWVAENQRYVAEKSDGRVGYLHIRSMGEPSFNTFERDLYAAAHGRDGLIVDVRNNGGGWTADWVIAVLSVRRHAYTVPRGGEPGYPQDRLIFYSWTKPATMMCNQHSFSNAEIVSHAFKNLGRGPLVGMTTFGGVISTGGYSLIDGTYVRMPFRGWYTLPDGRDMENHGAEPDVKVRVTPEDEAAGRDPQLDAAVRATLEQLGAQEPQPAEMP